MHGHEVLKKLKCTLANTQKLMTQKRGGAHELTEKYFTHRFSPLPLFG